MIAQSSSVVVLKQELSEISMREIGNSTVAMVKCSGWWKYQWYVSLVAY